VQFGAGRGRQPRHERRTLNYLGRVTRGRLGGIIPPPAAFQAILAPAILSIFVIHCPAIRRTFRSAQGLLMAGHQGFLSVETVAAPKR